ncbi:hypothetical protein TWF694_005221 [Orbilia ellipsospora]|uniref:Mid2 domain-containing protein n=1 Tax=Orbilia ellipsospora TaxID=2528407 RepID=A0AAV9WV37_9PEZI
MFARKQWGNFLTLIIASVSLFATFAASQTVDAPTAGDILTIGDSFDILWTGIGGFPEVTIGLTRASTSTTLTIASGSNDTDWVLSQSFTWIVPDVDPATDYRIYIEAINNTPVCNADGTACVAKRQAIAISSDSFTIRRKVISSSSTTTTPSPTPTPAPSPTPSPTPTPTPTTSPTSTTTTSSSEEAAETSSSSSTTSSAPSSTTSSPSSTASSTQQATSDPSKSSTPATSTRPSDTKTSTSSTSSETPPPAASSRSSPPIGAIVGGAVGGLAVIVVGAWLIARELRKRSSVPKLPPPRPVDPNNQSVWTGDKPYAWDPRVNTTDIYAGRAEEHHFGGVQR